MSNQQYRGLDRSTPGDGGIKSRGVVRTKPPRSRMMPVATRTGNRRGIARQNVARMAQPKLNVNVQDRLGQEAVKAAERLWPGQGQRAVNRLLRDAISRYLRYLGDGSRDRS